MQDDKKGCYLLLDVGGTNIKGSVFDLDDRKFSPIKEFPAEAKDSKDAIFDNFFNILTDLRENRKIAGVGFGFPGPFDYERGISLMKNINKYDSIYGISFREELGKRDKDLLECKMLFLHDVEAFAIGCASYKNACHSGRAICVCIGTGAGSAFLKDGKVVKDQRENVPENGWIYNTPFNDSIIDDYISVRGLERISKAIVGEKLNGYELFKRCNVNDPFALEVYRIFGNMLFDALEPFIRDFCPDTLVFGGRISNSFSFFGKSVNDFCKEKNIKIILEEDTSIRAMQGLLAQLEQL
ncbi:MAG: ROK family protein [Lachnospiraceae bacterium]|nr:ROK family protein [Lachnospiraceae bacterium]